MGILTEASQQWASRPADERYLSLLDMQSFMTQQRQVCQQRNIETRSLQAMPLEGTDNKGLVIISRGRESTPYAPTNWAFDQLARLGGAPPGYLRKLVAPLASDCINYGLHVERQSEEVQLLEYSNGTQELRAATGPKYGRIWNSEIVNGLIRAIGDGRTGRWKVPGEFGKQVDITKDNTTLYAGDRDMFVFLADEENRIEIANRRDGQPGTLARGFFVSNSEVGSAAFKVKTFLFDYACSNRIVWGAEDAKQITIRHSSGAPSRFLQEIQPALRTYAESSAARIEQHIEKAQKAKIDGDVNEWLAKRFTKSDAAALMTVHTLEEQRPIETLWDVSTAITARARGIAWQDDRVAMETEAGKVLDLVK